MIETKKSYCRFCHVCCGIEVDVDQEQQRVVAVRGDRDNPYSYGYTCVKGRAIAEEMHHPDRVLSPRRRVGSEWVDISSAQALDEIAVKLLDIKARYGPRSIAVYTAGGAGFSATGALTRLWLNAIGSQSLYSALTIDCPCVIVAAHRLFGTAVTPLGMFGGIFDIKRAEVAMYFGANPIISHGLGPAPAKQLRDAQARGMKLIVVDPRRTEIAARADLHLRIKPGEDAALLAAMIKIIIERRLYDHDYVAQYVSGLEALREAVKDFDLDYAARRTGVRAHDITQAATMFATAKTGAARGAAGITMSRHQNLNAHLIHILNALGGRIDRPGGLVCHPGVFAPARPQRPEPVRLPLLGDAHARVRGLQGLLIAPGMMEMPTCTLSDEILQPGEGQIRALIVHGGNPVAMFPDETKTIRALKALDLLVVMDLFMTATAKFAHYVLGARHFLERPDITNSLESLFPFPYGQYTPAALRGPGDLLEEWELGWELAQRMGVRLPLPGLSTERKPTSDEVIAAVATGSRIPLDEVRKYPSGHVFGDVVAGTVLPHAIAHPDKKMAAGHPDTLAELRAVRAESIPASGGYDQTETFTHRLVSMRMDETYNSKGQNLPSVQKKYRFNPAYMNPSDLTQLAVSDGDAILIDSGRGQVKAIVESSVDILPGTVALSHGWGGELGAPAARLIPDDELFDPVTGMALMTALPVNVHRVG